MFSTSDIPSSSIRYVDYTTSVPYPIYTSSQHEQRQDEKEPSPPTSPTFSAVTENGCYMYNIIIIMKSE